MDLLNKASAQLADSQALPCVSILIPACNEGATLDRKIQNIASMQYPKNKIEVIVIDDHSTDDSVGRARAAIRESEVNGRIIQNQTRMGVNACYNKGVAEARYDYILTTDADVALHKDALRIAASLLMQLKEVGGVTAKMITVSSQNTTAARVEDSFRDSFTSMMVSESAIFSTFPGYTCFTLFRKCAFSIISNEYGSSDGNISLAIIRNGFRFILAPTVLFYEPISQTMKEQSRQKVRRAKRLAQSAIMNRDMLFEKRYKEFGRLIFPLRFLMHIICPPLILLAISLIAVAMLSVGPLVLVVGCGTVLVLGSVTSIRLLNLPVSLLVHQIYMFCGLVSSFRRGSTWKHVGRGPLCQSTSSEDSMVVRVARALMSS